MKIMPTRGYRSPFTGTGTVYLYIINLFVSLVKVITAIGKCFIAQFSFPSIVKKLRVGNASKKMASAA
jgi:hypothetical protein